MAEEEQASASEAPDAEAQDAADLEGGSPPEETAEAEDQPTPDADAGDDSAEAEAEGEPPDTEAEGEPPDTEAEGEPPDTEAEGEPPDTEADAGGDDEERESDPAVQEVIHRDTTVVHHDEEPEHGVPTTFRTPPGIPGGLDPKTLGDRDRGPVPPDPDAD